MNEGPWTVAPNPCATPSHVLTIHKELSKAIQRVGAAVRMSQNESTYVVVRRPSIDEAVTAWQNANDIAEDACMAAERTLAVLLAAHTTMPPANKVKEVDD